eukprot:evm.model.NODE_5521_length_8807_cov_42.282162.3
MKAFQAPTPPPARRRDSREVSQVPALLLLLVVGLAFFLPIVHAQPDLGTCAPDGSNPLTADPVTNACACLAGWMGPECSVCTASSSCQAVQEQQNGEDNENLMASTHMICDRSLEVIERTHGMCRVATQAVSDFLQGRAYVTSQVTAAGDLHFEFIK